VLYDPRGLVDMENLAAIAQALLALKGTRNDDPALQHYADHLENETTRLFNWTPPSSWLPYPLTASTTYIDIGWLPGRKLAFSQFPILISDECPGHVVILPRELWPAPLLAQWGELASDVAPLPVVVTPSAQQMQDGERLYREGLELWHAVPSDQGAAIAKWREAGKLHHYLGLCALSAAISEMGTPGSASAASEQGAAAAFESFAIAEYRLGFVEAAKLHLRPDRPDARKGDQQARELLQLAASLGDRHALHMVKVMTRMAE